MVEKIASESQYLCPPNLEVLCVETKSFHEVSDLRGKVCASCTHQELVPLIEVLQMRDQLYLTLPSKDWVFSQVVVVSCICASQLSCNVIGQLTDQPHFIN